MSRVLGKGTHGTVSRIVEDGKYIAVKKMDNRRSMAMFSLEVSIMCTYDHPYLNRCIRVERTSQGELLLYQDLAERDLSSYIRSTCDLPITLAQEWTRSIAVGLHFLKHEMIVHGDIKPQNVLVYGDSTVKLADFGCAVVLSDEYVVVKSGTARYSSPETLLKSILSHAGDMWSLGCVVYEMLTRSCLIPASGKKKDDSEKYRIVKSIQAWRKTCGDSDIDTSEDLGSLRCLPISFSLDGDLGDLVCSMLHYQASRRMTIEQLLKSDWLNSVNTKSNVNISCCTLNTDVLAIAVNHIESYLSQRAVDLCESVVIKAASIYSRTSMETEVEMEAALVIAIRLFRVDSSYHPVSPSRLLDKTVATLLEASQYRVHKYAMSELYIKLGK